MGRIASERQAKLQLGDWLKERGCRVYDERKNPDRIDWDGFFQITNVQRSRKPDLLVVCNTRSVDNTERRYNVALEVKIGRKHTDLAEGFDDVLQYFSDYCWEARYSIKELIRPSTPHSRTKKSWSVSEPTFARAKTVRVDVIALATAFSPNGYLYKKEHQFGRKLVEGEWWKAYPITFTISRLLARQRINILNNLKEFSTNPRAFEKVNTRLRTQRLPEVGVLVQYSIKPEKDTALLVMSTSPFYWEVIGK